MATQLPPGFVLDTSSSQPSVIELEPSSSQRRAARQEQESIENTDFSQIQSLRKEYQAQASVAEYKTALGTYSSALEAAATPQGDQSLITSYAKMLDPNSVVREGEFAVTASTESTLNQLKARLAKEFGWEEGGMLTPTGRLAIKREMRNLVLNRFKPAYERDRIQYQRYAQAYGFDPYKVVGEDVGSQYDPKLLDPLTAPEQDRTLAAPGSTTKEGVQIPPEYQQEHYRYLQEHWGKIDPADYAEFRSGLDRKYDLNPDPEAYRAAVAGFNAMAATGGTPGQLGAVPNPSEPMETFLGVPIESALNTAAQSNTGAFLANAGNAGGFGLPAALSGGQDELQILREQRPGASLAGEIAGGVTGTLGAGAGLNLGARAFGAGRAANFLTNPATADLVFGSTYGATQDTENPFRGAVVGATGAALGNRLGSAFGKAFPGAVKPRALGQAEAAVPNSVQGKQIASDLYSQAEAAGTPATPEQTKELLERSAAVLRGEGRITPKGAPIDLDSPTTRAYKLIEDYAGEPMGPKQAGVVRNVLGEGRASPDPAQARVSRILTDEFDQWADPVLPGVSDARNAAERYIQGDIIKTARELAESDAARRFSQSGLENATRSRFGALDRGIVNGTERFSEPTAQAIMDVARGTPGSNFFRNVGKLAPTGVIPGGFNLMAGGAIAGATGPMTGALTFAGLSGLGAGSRALATQMAKQRAKQAELIARDPAFAVTLDEIKKAAAARAGHIGSGLFAVPASAYSR